MNKDQKGSSKDYSHDGQAVVTFGYVSEPGAADRLALQGYVIIDCRSLPNPWKDVSLRDLTGTDGRILEYLRKHAPNKVESLLRLALRQRNKLLAFGCAHGRHRSVAIATEFERRRNAKDNFLSHFTPL